MAIGAYPLMTFYRIFYFLLLLTMAGTGRVIASDQVSKQPLNPIGEALSEGLAPIDVDVPNVTMTKQDGSKALFKEELDDGRPVMLNFVYTACATSCPVASQSFAKAQQQLGDKVHFVSISIDPETDTPDHLKRYSEKFKAAPGWDHYTGNEKDSIAIQKAFKAFGGDKMNHRAVTFIRPSPDKPWVKVEGFTTSKILVQTFEKISKASL